MAFYRNMSVARGLLLAISLGLLSGCIQSPQTPLQADGIYDPNEVRNRKAHAFNKKVFGNGNGTYAKVVPVEFQSIIHNVSTNLSMPQVAVNSLLQGDLRGTGVASYRFVLNSTLGIGGLFDPATEFKFPTHDTDFGETLHVWGAPEGKYQELPLIGPSTQRDTVGRVVDMFTDPLGYVIVKSPEKYVAPVTGILDKMGKGSRRSGAIDDLLNNSADSYAQTRLIYLQKRRYELSGKSEVLPDYEDPYAE